MPRSPLARLSPPAPARRRLHARITALALALAVAPALACLKVPPEDTDSPDAAGAPASAEALIARYVDAIGGEKALRAITARTVESRMAINPEEGCEEDDEECMREAQTGTFTLQTDTKGHLYRRTVVGNQIEERGYDGENGWQFQQGILVLDDAETLAATREDAVLHWYFDLDKRGIKVSLEKTRDKDQAGKPATLDGIRWKTESPATPEKTMWFDRETGLLREELVEEEGGDGVVLRQWVLYDDYRDVDGVKIAHTIRLVSELGERSQEVVFTTQRVDHAAIDAKVFAIPELPKREPAKDEILVALEAARKGATESPKEVAEVVAHARIAWAAAHFEEAAEAASAALKLDAKESEALWILARAQVLMGRWKDAQKTLERAAKAGLRPELIAAQRAWIASHNRDYAAVAKALDATGEGNAPLAAQYRTFAGKPLVVSMAGDGCTSLVPLKQAKTTLPLVEIEIGGVEVMAMIDTGAADVILDDELAKQLKVPVRSTTPLGRQGDEIGHGQLESITIGDATVKSVPVDIFSTGTIAAMSASESKSVRAVIGVRFLELFQVTVDPDSSTLTLVNAGAPKCKKALEANREGSSVPFWIHETHFIYVMAAMNGAEGLFLLNTGIQGVDMAATTKAFARAAIGPPPLRRGQASLVRVDELAFGDHRSKGVVAAYGYFEQSKSSDDFRVDGMLGLGALGLSRWTLDFADRRIYLTPGTSGGSGG
ncbi:MAG: retropepsin-like domain-containing protein [Myxococcales bacterium]|nr:retropepsin-like domain-containing protein [Myxococcales bacterium]